jgi:galactose-1-phosphate uridylyltransferase
MEKYLIGIIEVVPFAILNEGLRKELVEMISNKLEQRLVFGKCENIADYEKILKSVGEELDSLKKSMEYLQDLLNVYG